MLPAWEPLMCYRSGDLIVSVLRSDASGWCSYFISMIVLFYGDLRSVSLCVPVRFLRRSSLT
jgi:hypothetical protein